jgi:hypothetical protein
MPDAWDNNIISFKQLAKNGREAKLTSEKKQNNI